MSTQETGDGRYYVWTTDKTEFAVRWESSDDLDELLARPQVIEAFERDDLFDTVVVDTDRKKVIKRNYEYLGRPRTTEETST